MHVIVISHHVERESLEYTASEHVRTRSKTLFTLTRGNRRPRRPSLQSLCLNNPSLVRTYIHQKRPTYTRKEREALPTSIQPESRINGRSTSASLVALRGGRRMDQYRGGARGSIIPPSGGAMHALQACTSCTQCWQHTVTNNSGIKPSPHANRGPACRPQIYTQVVARAHGSSQHAYR